ncbi:MAG: hypothetical protein LBQ22_07250 [Bacteroidales bacterium]|jgi:hypothetical protein|nr:hypothetical protein [Bacteroidales bacterium]
MNTTIQNSIQSRRNALTEYYNLPQDALQKTDNLFERITQFGQQFEDPADFETKFMASPLNNEYVNLFSEFALYVKTPEGTLTVEEQRKVVAKENAESVAKHQIERGIKGAIVRRLPKPLYDWYIYGIYNIPVLGRLVSAKNTVESFSGKKPFKKKNKEEETNDKE